MRGSVRSASPLIRTFLIPFAFGFLQLTSLFRKGIRPAFRQSFGIFRLRQIPFRAVCLQSKDSAGPCFRQGSHEMSNGRPSSGARHHNAAAFLAIGASALVAFSCFDPVPAGEEPPRVNTPREVEIAVPVPPEATDIAAGERTSVMGQETPVVPTGSTALSEQETAIFCLLMLEDGARFLRNLNSYSAVFHKQERIGGDLSDLHQIELKVRHSPAFGVYMKWRNGDKGRQVLFNSEEEDQRMVVKLGGLKGKFLPAVKLDPEGSQAMAEARYPVTKAGLLAMAERIIELRREEINQDIAVTCRRLANQQVDERSCYCFLFEYASRDISPIYRKSLVMIDTRYHVPMRVLNHTWTNDEDGLTAEQIDENTLIEHYSFSDINFAKEYVAEDFSRDNPLYRM